MARPSNLLVLDEPTNDLDLETLDLFQEVLADYAGTVLLVSHDRDFLDRVVTSVIASNGDGRWTEYAGGYTDMMRQRQPAPAAAPRASARLPRAKTETPKPVPAPKCKLSFKEMHARKTLPLRMAELETKIARMRAVLADPELYARDRQAFAEAAVRARARGYRNTTTFATMTDINAAPLGDLFQST
ncbi:MAG: hypothetical protein EA406_10320 [Rhodospirillales bacterium]|nr:MAG: hypothetical protein EA406_10320 [Rhodospirillales bacterium]